MGSILQSLPLTYPEDSFPVPSAIPIATEYTSLIIDARGLEVTPMLSPAVYAADGLEIYNRYFVDPAFAVRTGIAAYVQTEKEACKHPKAGSHPLITAAIGNVKSNPIISTRDIRRILSSPGNIMELKKCRVIFIVDRWTNMKVISVIISSLLGSINNSIVNMDRKNPPVNTPGFLFRHLCSFRWWYYSWGIVRQRGCFDQGTPLAEQCEIHSNTLKAVPKQRATSAPCWKAG